MGSEKAEARRGTLESTPEEAAEGVAGGNQVDGERAPVAGVARVGFAPIVRVDAPSREVELCATSEALDSYGTVFDYGASKDAFTRWAGNVREMHDRRAVGRRVLVRCDDETRRIFVRVRISRGAQDTGGDGGETAGTGFAIPTPPPLADFAEGAEGGGRSAITKFSSRTAW